MVFIIKCKSFVIDRECLSFVILCPIRFNQILSIFVITSFKATCLYCKGITQVLINKIYFQLVEIIYVGTIP